MNDYFYLLKIDDVYELKRLVQEEIGTLENELRDSHHTNPEIFLIGEKLKNLNNLLFKINYDIIRTSTIHYLGPDVL